MYIYIYICHHENNVPSRLCTHALRHMMYGYTLLVAINQRVLNKPSKGSNINALLYITLFALLVEHSLVHWYQQCVTEHHVPKCMTCHQILCRDNREGTLSSWLHIYYPHLAYVRFEHSVCRRLLMTIYICIYIYIYIIYILYIYYIYIIYIQ